MEINALLADLFGRIGEHVHEAVHGLDPATLVEPPAPGTNPIGWLIWHSTRVQDHHLAAVLGEEQLWTTGDWAVRFGVTPDPENTGYGHSAEQVQEIRPESAAALIDYYGAVAARMTAFLEQVTAADLDRVVDRRWDPPVTLGVRLISIADDDIQHTGQAVFARGMWERRTSPIE